MKYLSHYLEDGQSEALDWHDGFFAFSNKQLEEQLPDGADVKDYVSMGAGLVCHKDSAKELAHDLANNFQRAVDADRKENGKKAIIQRELANHECQITMDYDVVVEVLHPYGITREDVKAEWREFWNMCVENNYF